MNTKVKYFMVFILGLITPIAIVLILSGVIFIRNYENINKIYSSVVNVVENVKMDDQITYLDIYNGTIIPSDELTALVNEKVASFDTSFGDNAQKLVAFRADRVRSKVNFIASLEPYVEKIKQLNSKIQNVNLSENEKVQAIDDLIQTINQLITKLQNSSISFSDEIAKLNDLKNTLVSLKTSVSLSEMEKEQLKNNILDYIIDETKEVNLNIALEGINPNIANITFEQKIEILKSEYSNIQNQIVLLQDEVSNLKIENKSLSDALESAKITIEKQSNELDIANSELDLANNEIDDLQTKLDGTVIIINELNAKIKGYETIIKTLRENNQISDDTINQLNQDIADLETEINDLKPEEEVTYTDFEQYLIPGTTSPFIDEYTKNENITTSIDNVETTKTSDSVYDTITITSSAEFSDEEINYIISLLTKQLAITNYDANIKLIIQPNNQSVDLFMTDL